MRHQPALTMPAPSAAAMALIAKACRSCAGLSVAVAPRGPTVAPLLIRTSTGPPASRSSRALVRWVSLGVVGQVGSHDANLNTRRARSDGVGGFAESVGGTGEKADIGCVLGKSDRGPCSDAAARASDQSGLANKPSGHARGFLPTPCAGWAHPRPGAPRDSDAPEGPPDYACTHPMSVDPSRRLTEQLRYCAHSSTPQHPTLTDQRGNTSRSGESAGRRRRSPRSGLRCRSPSCRRR